MANAWRAKNKTIQILQAAEKGGYGVLSGNAYNIEQICGMISAAEKTRSPFIINLFPRALAFNGILVKAAAELARNASVPVSVHLDHCQSEELVLKAADLPFDSIMVDMSHYEKEENLAKTAKLVKHCNERGISTEAEPGRIEGGEDGVADTEGMEGMLTTPVEADEFIATGIDFLAPAFGNIHGPASIYGEKGPQLEFDRLRKIRASTKGRVNMVLHGTNGFSDEIIKECVACGMSKLNVNGLVNDDWLTYLKENAAKVPLTTLLDETTVKVEKMTMRLMEVCGSAGKA